MTLISKSIYERCLNHYSDVRMLDFVVPESLPIPYFGNLSDFLKSELRIVTAALNPSNQEFPPGAPRFNVLRGLRGATELETELSAYFMHNPYSSWFKAFEPVINGLGASYGGKLTNEPYALTALHVDLCSPIATHPTWSILGKEERSRLKEVGREIFSTLIGELNPHLIIASVGWTHIENWNDVFQSRRDWSRLIEYKTSVHGNPLRMPIAVQGSIVSLPNSRPIFFVNASAAEKPFGRFSTDRKRHVGEVLHDWMRSRS